jgi:hypothetical protein
MKIIEAREAVAGMRRLWDGAGGGQTLPPQSAFDAFALRPWLPNVILVEVHRGTKRFFYRLTGSRIDEMYGQNFTGRWLEDLRIPGSAGYWERNYAKVAAELAPLTGSVEHVDLAHNQMMCNWIMLPLQPDLPARGDGVLELVILAGIMFYRP